MWKPLTQEWSQEKLITQQLTLNIYRPHTDLRLTNDGQECGLHENNVTVWLITVTPYTKTSIVMISSRIYRSCIEDEQMLMKTDVSHIFFIKYLHGKFDHHFIYRGTWKLLNSETTWSVYDNRIVQPKLLWK